MDGKIYIDSRIANTQEWLGKDITKYQAIIDLYMMADKSGDKAVVRTSENELSKRWGWNRRRVGNFLTDLEQKSIAKISKQKGGNTRNCTTNCTTNGTTKNKEMSLQNITYVPPTIEDVKTYCAERNSPIDAEVFYDYYATRGWKIGKDKTPIDDWKACLRSWEHKEYRQTNLREEAPENEYEFWRLEEPTGVQA